MRHLEATPSLARPHYLALLHIFDTSTGSTGPKDLHHWYEACCQVMLLCSGYAHHALGPHVSSGLIGWIMPRQLRYRFGAEPPFMMLQVSSQLPLTEAAATPGTQRDLVQSMGRSHPVGLAAQICPRWCAFCLCKWPCSPRPRCRA